mmetsp:Transcript_35052/g.48614  ORF Transcript_35052/g.48614 Transcript_35052/m.48614 type:complete len:90 (-) Transcript_35052:97-366(-)
MSTTNEAQAIHLEEYLNEEDLDFEENIRINFDELDVFEPEGSIEECIPSWEELNQVAMGGGKIQVPIGKAARKRKKKKKISVRPREKSA